MKFLKKFFSGILAAIEVLVCPEHYWEIMRETETDLEDPLQGVF